VRADGQIESAPEFRTLVIAYRNGAAVRLSDVGEVVDSVEDLRNQGLANGRPSVLVILSREPGANIIDTVDRVKDVLPQLRASIPAGAELAVASDRTTTIRASLRDVEYTLAIAIALVILVVFVFLRSVRATVIPGVAVPISLIGTLGVMYLLGYSINNLSLMALTIATGFVVDDAIVVMENVTRYVEAGVPRLEAALRGAAEVGFTVLSMSLSLIAVFIPILLMSGILGRLFREFAITLSVAILVSLAVSLTTTPMMCAYFIPDRPERRGRLYRWSERGFDWLVAAYGRTLDWALRHALAVVLILAGVLALNAYLYLVIPKGFFPSRTPAGSSAASRATRARPSSSCGASCSSSSTWCARIPRSTRWWASPAAARPTADRSSSPSSPARSGACRSTR